MHPLTSTQQHVIVHGGYPSVFRIQSKKCLNATMTALLPPSGFFFFLLHSLLAVFCLQCQGFVLRASLYHGSDHIPQAVRLAAKDERTPKDEEAGDEGMSALEAKLAQLRAMTDRIETNLQDDDDEESDENDTRSLPVDEALARLERVRLEGEAMDRELIRGMVGEDEDGLDTEERAALEEGIESLKVDSRRARLVSLIADNQNAKVQNSQVPSPALARLQSRLKVVQMEAKDTDFAASIQEPAERNARTRLQQKLLFLDEQAQVVTERSVGRQRLQKRWDRIQMQASAVKLDSSQLSIPQTSKDAQTRLITKQQKIQAEAAQFYGEEQSNALQTALDALVIKEAEKEPEQATLELGTLFSEKFSQDEREKVVEALFEVNQTLFFEDLHALENEAVRLEANITSMELEKWHTLDEMARVDDNILVLKLQEKDFSSPNSKVDSSSSGNSQSRIPLAGGSPAREVSLDGGIETEGQKGETTVLVKETVEESLVNEILDVSLVKESVDEIVDAAEGLTNALQELEADSELQVRSTDEPKEDESSPQHAEVESANEGAREPGRYKARYEPAVSSVDSWMKRGSIMEDSGNHFSVW